MYFNLIKKFNPIKFNPEPWARAAKTAGMKYVVFTTKHHDGFSMWDTKETDFRITGPDSPFHDHPKSNVVKEIFNSFREQKFMIGAYFSKADWHHPDYWWPLYATPNRNNNYDINKYPDKWQRFRDFTFNQINEIMTGYGNIDILWLDGGWVRPDSTINDEVRSWGFDIAKWEQDIDMPRIVQMARKHQPGLIVVDRTVHGPYENYRTPEQRVPDQPLFVPWETNMTMTQSWGHTNDPKYKTVRKLIHTLVDVVAKGGNFLLNVAPTPEGTFEDEAYRHLDEIGQWMKVNNEAIYSSRPIAPYKKGKFAFTQNRNTKAVYAIYLSKSEEDQLLRKIFLENIYPEMNTNLTMLGVSEKLEWETIGDGCLVEITENIIRNQTSKYAWVIKIDKIRSRLL